MPSCRRTLAFLLAAEFLAATGCVDDPLGVPVVLTTPPGPWIEGATFVATLSSFDIGLRIVSTDPSVVAVDAPEVVSHSHSECRPSCITYGAMAVATGVGTAELELYDAESQLIDSQIIGVARGDRLDVSTVVGLGAYARNGITLAGASIDGERITVRANEVFELDLLASSGSSTLLGGSASAEVDGESSCTTFDESPSLLRFDGLAPGEHEVTLRIGMLERSLIVDAVAPETVTSLEIAQTRGASIGVALRAVARDATGTEVLFFRDVEWTVAVDPDFMPPPGDSPALRGAILADYDSTYFFVQPTLSRRIVVRSGDLVAETDVAFGNSTFVLDAPLGTTCD